MLQEPHIYLLTKLELTEDREKLKDQGFFMNEEWFPQPKTNNNPLFFSLA